MRDKQFVLGHNNLTKIKWALASLALRLYTWRRTFFFLRGDSVIKQSAAEYANVFVRACVFCFACCSVKGEAMELKQSREKSADWQRGKEGCYLKTSVRVGRVQSDWYV